MLHPVELRARSLGWSESRPARHRHGPARRQDSPGFVRPAWRTSQAVSLPWLKVSDEPLERLRVLGGYDDDLARDANRTANRLR
jgi:hypothetical protein